MYFKHWFLIIVIKVKANIFFSISIMKNHYPIPLAFDLEMMNLIQPQCADENKLFGKQLRWKLNVHSCQLLTLPSERPSSACLCYILFCLFPALLRTYDPVSFTDILQLHHIHWVSVSLAMHRQYNGFLTFN